jgi:hypothetical protein
MAVLIIKVPNRPQVLGYPNVTNDTIITVDRISAEAAVMLLALLEGAEKRGYVTTRAVEG